MQNPILSTDLTWEIYQPRAQNLKYVINLGLLA